MRVSAAAQQFKQFVAYAIYSPCTERDDQIAFTDSIAQHFRGALDRTNVLDALMPVTLDPFSQHFRVDAFNWLLTGGVNVSYQQHIGIVKGARKLFHQVLCP